jgi:serine/threonine protein kinase
MHALSAQTHAEVLDMHAELRHLGGRLGEFYEVIIELRERLKVSEQEVSPSDCQSVSNEGDLRQIREVKSRYWSLPAEDRKQAPALGNAVGALSMAAGDYPDAEKAFALAAETAGDAQAQVVAHLNAYQAALQQGQWEAALEQLRKAISRGGRSVAPFPVERYRPERILGAGGFGVAFLCRHTRTEALVVVKAIQREQFDRDLGAIFREAMALEQLEHPAIIRVRDCDFADPEACSRPYLVMDYFEGLTVAEQVRRHGPLAPADFLEVAGQVASALAAAHSRGILHRDVKPANILLRRQGERWQVKLIDFGLAFRLRSVLETVQRSQSMQNTLLGQSIAGTIDYAAPEQMGKLPGVGVSQASDVYGFGKTCCYALFGTPNPGRRHWKQLENETLCDLLDACLSEQPQDRPGDFGGVLRRLGGASQPASGQESGKQSPVPEVVSQLAVSPVPATGDSRITAGSSVPQVVTRTDVPVAVPVAPAASHREQPQPVKEERRKAQREQGEQTQVAAAPRSAEKPGTTSQVTHSSEVTRATFRFSSGAETTDLKAFVRLCEKHWEDAKRHLMEGHFEPWLRTQGRDDLAKRAATARASGWSNERALVHFLEECGAEGWQVARLKEAEATRLQRQQEPEQNRPIPAPAHKPTPPAQQWRAAGNDPWGDFFKSLLGRNAYHLGIAISLALLLLRSIGCISKDTHIPFYDKNKPSETRLQMPPRGR